LSEEDTMSSKRKTNAEDRTRAEEREPGQLGSLSTQPGGQRRLVSTRWKVLVSAPYMQPVIERFRPMFEEHDVELFVPPVNERFEEEDLLEWIGDIDGVICGDDRFTERVLEAAPRLKVISKWGTGTDSIDKAAAGRLGIAVRNTPNAFSEPVADSVIGY